MTKKYYIYLYFDPTRDDEPFYVGKGKGNRAISHLSRTDHHPVTYRIQKIRKLGHEPKIELEYCESEDAAYSLEHALVLEIGRRNTGTGPLLNLTDGGEGGRGMVLSTEQRMRIAEGTSKAQKGKPNGPMSESQKKTISNSLKASYTDEMKSNLKKQVTCPHCGKSGTRTAMYRWHFEKCRHSNK